MDSDALKQDDAPNPIAGLQLSEAIALWLHFEERASEEKNRMIATVTLLVTVGGALLCAAITEKAKLPSAAPIPPEAAEEIYVLSLCPAVLGLIGLWLTWQFALHANRNYARTDILMGLHCKLKEIKDTLVRPRAPKRQKTQSVFWVMAALCFSMIVAAAAVAFV